MAQERQERPAGIGPHLPSRPRDRGGAGRQSGRTRPACAVPGPVPPARPHNLTSQAWSPGAQTWARAWVT
jgi:hypothetical protein